MPTRFATPLLSRRSLPLLGVLLLSLALRVWGVTWGLPSALHYFSYHPDESRVLEAASLPNMSVFAGHLLPHFYDYGSLQLYLVCFANTLAMLFGAVDIVPKEFPGWTSQWAKMYLVGRCLTVGMGVGTVFAVYGIGKRLWGRRTGLLAALVLATMPLHAQHSHFLTVDVPAAFWETLSLLWAVRLATGDPKFWRAVLWGGLFAGLAAATKYNLAVAVVPLLAACVLVEPTPPQQWLPGAAAASLPETGGARGPDEEEFADRPWPIHGMVGEEDAINPLPALDSLTFSPSRNGSGSRLQQGRFLLGLIAFVAAFFAACPGAILERAIFWRDLRFEAVHVQNGDDPTFRDTGNGFVYHMTRNLDAGLGLPLLLLSLASIGYALYRRERGDGLLAAFALPYYVLISLAAVRYARYTIPLLPILALWVGRMMADWSTAKVPAWRSSGRWISAVTLGLTLIWCTRLIGFMAEQDLRDWALRWMNSPILANRASGQPTVGFAVMPWFGTPPLSPYFAMPRRGGWQQYIVPQTAARIVYAGHDWDAALLEARKPDMVVLSEFDYTDAIRLKEPAALHYLEILRRDYRPSFTLVDNNSALSTQYTRMAGLPTRDWPHDMLYPCPIISIYKRNH